MNRVMDRFNGHRADLKGKDENKLAWHLKRNGHTEDRMRVLVLEQVAGDDDVYRFARGRYWINRMGTLAEESFYPGMRGFDFVFFGGKRCTT